MKKQKIAALCNQIMKKKWNNQQYTVFLHVFLTLFEATTVGYNLVTERHIWEKKKASFNINYLHFFFSFQCKKCEKSDDVDACKAECEKCLESVDKDAEVKTQFEEMFKCMEPQFKKELAEVVCISSIWIKFLRWFTKMWLDFCPGSQGAAFLVLKTHFLESIKCVKSHVFLWTS